MKKNMKTFSGNKIIQAINLSKPKTEDMEYMYRYESKQDNKLCISHHNICISHHFNSLNNG